MFSPKLNLIAPVGFCIAAITLAACSSVPTVTKERMTLGEANIDGMDCRREKARFGYRSRAGQAALSVLLHDRETLFRILIQKSRLDHVALDHADKGVRG